MDSTLLEKAMALYEQEQQQQQSTPDCQHAFEHDPGYGQRVCFNCGVIDPSPLLIASPDYLYYTPRSKPNKTAYLKKCIAEHDEQYNCFIPCEVYEAFKSFQLCFIRMFPKEQKISVRYTLYRIAQLYGHPCPEAAFLNIKLCKIENAMSRYVIKSLKKFRTYVLNYFFTIHMEEVQLVLAYVAQVHDLMKL